jgi:DNA-binding LacI/PurR family transcriptional regulator
VDDQDDPQAKELSLQSASQIDVARLAGVSQAAVSRTFTPGASVSDETRDRVLEAAQRLKYRPNAIARSLIRKSTHIIGVVVMRLSKPFYARIIREFTRGLQVQGYWTLLFDIADDSEVDTTLPMALQYQVDGVVITSATLSSKLADEFTRNGTPVVLFNRYAASSQTHVVRCDNYAGGRMVADAFLDAGHQRIAYVAGEEGSSTNLDRERGLVDRLQERGAQLWRRAGGDYSYEAGYAAALQLLQDSERPDAIFCADDMTAIGAMDAARYELGLRIPEDLSVIGFDDIPMAAWSAYSLTTICQPFKEMVGATIHQLLAAIADPNAKTVNTVIAPTIAVRGSARLGRAEISEG